MLTKLGAIVACRILPVGARPWGDGQVIGPSRPWRTPGQNGRIGSKRRISGGGRSEVVVVVVGGSVVVVGASVVVVVGGSVVVVVGGSVVVVVGGSVVVVVGGSVVVVVGGTVVVVVGGSVVVVVGGAVVVVVGGVVVVVVVGNGSGSGNSWSGPPGEVVVVVVMTEGLVEMTLGCVDDLPGLDVEVLPEWESDDFVGAFVGDFGDELGVVKITIFGTVVVGPVPDVAVDGGTVSGGGVATVVGVADARAV